MPVPVILDCRSSPFSQLKPVPVDSVRFTGGFWADRVQSVKQTSIPAQYDQLEVTGRLDNFRRISKELDLPFQGYFYNDSDVYKWLEAACWLLASDNDEQIQERINEVIHLISDAQDRDGYLNTYFSGEKKEQRWTNLRDMHELYCAGHLIQAAIAHHRVTSHAHLLSVAVGLADHICDRFLNTGVPAASGHPEIEMALVELYRTVGDVRYLQMAKSFLDQRGFGVIGGRSYHLDHVPFREMARLEGHAVRALYLCCAAADIYMETGEKALRNTLDRLWIRMAAKQMYVTGGVGSRHEGEAFGDDFELPNMRAYAETCAAIGSVMWNWRMLHASDGDNQPGKWQPEVKYSDLIEWTLYNAVLPGIGLGGETYHYVNPLEVHDIHERQPWFSCACCPTNIIRLISSIGGYFYSRSENNVWIHQYASNICDIQLSEQLRVTLSATTDYPWSGEVEIELISVSGTTAQNGEEPTSHSTSFGIHLRIPAWLQEAVPVYINGALWQYPGMPGSYLQVYREWKPGDKLKFEFPMHTRFLECHPSVHENKGRLAICRGALLYCLEASDHPNLNPLHVYLQLDGSYTIKPVEIRSKIIQGIHLNAKIREVDDNWTDRLYQERGYPVSVKQGNKTSITAIPYFAWGNRSPGWMQVWINHD